MKKTDKIFTFLDLCSGIGGGRLGLEKIGLKCIGYSDTSRLAKKTYNLLFDAADEPYYYNLKKIKTNELPLFDMLIAGFPCQSFSVIGRKEGFDDIRGQLIFHIIRILRETHPKCFLLENVKGLVTHDKGHTIEKITNELRASGYDVIYKVLSSIDFGVPQMRQRVYFVGIRKDLSKNIDEFIWPAPVKKPNLNDYLIDNNKATIERLEILQYYLNNPTNQGQYTINDILEMEGKIIDTRMNDLRIYEGKCPTLRAQRDGILYVRNNTLYQLTGYEALLLQGFPKEYADKVKDIVSDRHLLMQAGNAMTVNVISEIGKKIIEYIKDNSKTDFNEDEKEIVMKPGEAFELRCFEYLKKFYETQNTKFKREGGMDSTKSDIAVIKNGNIEYYIEAKDTNAQSGQFVLIPDDEEKIFRFSPRNRSKPNEMTDIIIEYMNQNYDKFRNAGTSGESLDIDSKVFSEWIVDHYKEKNVKYVISYQSDYVILPIRRFAQYFDICANYRTKKSGSSEPSKRDTPSITKKIEADYPSASFSKDGKKLYAEIHEEITQDKTIIGNNTYYLAERSPNVYEVRRLSNTNNMNVIFQIHIKRSQDDDDLSEFESDL